MELSENLDRQGLFPLRTRPSVVEMLLLTLLPSLTSLSPLNLRRRLRFFRVTRPGELPSPVSPPPTSATCSYRNVWGRFHKTLQSTRR